MGVKDKKENLEFQLFKNTHFILNDTQKNALLSFHRCQVLLSKKIQRSNRTMLTEISINEWKIINIKGASTSKKESLNDKPDFIDSKKTYVKDYQVAAGQKVRLIYCLKEKKILAYLINQAGELQPIQEHGLPKELRNVNHPMEFLTFLNDAYVKIVTSMEGDVSLFIHQRGRGGKPMPPMEGSNIVIEEEKKEEEIQEEIFWSDEADLDIDEKKLNDLEQKLQNFESLGTYAQRSSILNIMEILKKNSFKSDHKVIIMFIGCAGTGKTTLTNYLAGVPIEVKIDEKRNAHLEINAINQNPLKVGHGFASCINMPVPQIDSENNLVYIDCPGIGGNRGLVHELIQARSVQSVINSADEVKFVITIPESAFFRRDNNQDLSNPVKILESYFPDFDQIKEALLLVVTQGDPRRKDHTLLKKKLNELLKDYHNGDLPSNPYQQKFLQFIHDQARFQYAFKIEKNREGLVSQAERESILDQVKNTLQYVQRKSALKVLKISAEAKLLAIAQYAGQWIQEEIKLLGEAIQSDYDKLMNEAKIPFKTIIENLDEVCSQLEKFTDNSSKELYEQLEQSCLDSKSETLTRIKDLEAALSFFQQANAKCPAYDRNIWKIVAKRLRETRVRLKKRCLLCCGIAHLK